LRSASACWPFLALVLAVAATAPADAGAGASTSQRASALRAIDEHRTETSRAEKAIRERPPRNEAASAPRPLRQPPHRSAWLCIQRHEGPWTDAGAPYFGGLQMDLSFQRAYGPELLRRKGTANRWTPLEQMWVAERALARGTGFHPWPNAARLCGLL
jgi:hypothetical protein